MFAVKGVFEQGRARPIGKILGREGQAVIITFLDELVESEDDDQVESEDAWQAMSQLIEVCSIETGIPDLAHQ